MNNEVEGEYVSVLFMETIVGKNESTLSGRGVNETAAMSNLLIKVREVAWNRCLLVESNPEKARDHARLYIGPPTPSVWK